MATASGQIQPLKIPDAVVALAQAAAKANGETEKYLPGWPLFSPPKMQLTKCAKCPREFCSSVALRRHSRVHRRALKIDKDFPKNRDHVAAFWDKLTVDQAQTIMSLEDVVIEGVKGLSNSILTALSSWMCKPGYTSLPLAYARAGNELLDLIQTRASRLPISSNKLFYMLDEGSENTFLCTKTADAASIQKYLFDGEVEKVATELKNVVACTSYILEQKLVEAWSADKAAEALRCQKLLVEEEDAAQKRQAEIMERKRMKKLRQKEQISKDLKDEEDAMVRLPEMTDGAADYPEIQSLDAISGPGLCEEEDQRYLQLPTHCTFDSGREMDTVAVTREQPVSTSDVDRLDNARQAGIVSGSGIPSKHPPSARHSRHRDPNGSSASNRSGTFAWKVRADVEERCPEAKLDAEGGHETVLGTDKSARLLIGSISVAVQNEKCLQGLQCLNDPPAPESHSDIVNHTLVSHAKDGCEDTNGGSTTQTAENLSPSSVVTEQSGLNNAELASGGGDSQGAAVFSSKEAAVFLSQRWKEAMGGDHVKLVVCSEN